MAMLAVSKERMSMHERALQQLDPDGTRWEFVRPLGEGGMASVALLQNKAIRSRRAVLKVFKPAIHANAGQSLWNRFRAEAHAAYELSTSEQPGANNIVKIIDTEMPDHGGDKVCYILMEYCEGGDLSQHIQTYGVMPPLQAVGVAESMLLALALAHGFSGSSGALVHRDLKPHNIFFRKGKVRVGDWGLVKRHSDTRMQQTRVGAKMGTLYYMPPEQYEDAAGVDGRADLYAVGVMLYTMLVGKELSEYPFFGLPEVDYAEIHSCLARVIRRAVSKSPDDRYQTAEEFLQELRVCREDLSSISVFQEFALGSAPGELKRRAAMMSQASSPSRTPAQLPDLPSPPEGGGSAMTAVPDSMDGEFASMGPLPTPAPQARRGTVYVENSDLEADREADVVEAKMKARRTLRMAGGVLLLLLVVVGLPIYLAVDYFGRDSPAELPIEMVDTTPEPVVQVEAPPEQPPEPVLTDVVETPEAEPVRAKVPTSRSSQPRETKAKVAVTAPDPVAQVEAPPEQPPEPEMGTFRVLGWSSVQKMRITCSGQSLNVMGSTTTLPVGPCVAHVTFKDDMGMGEISTSFVMEPGLVALKCDGSTMTCL
jgi:serine/threonine protein kinase